MLLKKRSENMIMNLSRSISYGSFKWCLCKYWGSIGLTDLFGWIIVITQFPCRCIRSSVFSVINHLKIYVPILVTQASPYKFIPFPTSNDLFAKSISKIPFLRPTKWGIWFWQILYWSCHIWSSVTFQSSSINNSPFDLQNFGED